LWRFGLRVVADAREFSNLGVRQDRGRLFKDVASRHRVVETPHQMQRTIPAGQCLIPPTVMGGAFGVVPDMPVRELVAALSRDAVPEVIELGVGDL
jgi:hypothetical protein